MRALPRGDARRGRFLDDLLVAALHRAVALAQMDDVAVVVGEHLELDVARPLEEFLHVDLVVAEGRARFGLRDGDRVQQRTPRLCTTRMPRPPPPPDALMMTG